MNVIEIELSSMDCESSISLLFKTLNNSVSCKWIKHLERALSMRLDIQSHYIRGGKSRGHFIGFPDQKMSKYEVSSLINKKIDVINRYIESPIDLRSNDCSSQEDMNNLHKYFELLRGPALQPTELFQFGGDEIRSALEDFNILIHEFESLLSSQLDILARSQLDICFEGEVIREHFDANDYENNFLHRDFGGVYLHYAEVGKSIMDVYSNNDSVVGDNNMRPLEYISSAFDIYFGEDEKEIRGVKFKRDLSRWLRSHDLDILDKRLSLGFIKIGQLIQDQRISNNSHAELVSLIGEHANVKKIVIH